MRPLLPVLMMIAAPAPAAAEQPVLSVAHTPAPPAIDGLIGDDEWAASPLLDGMALTHGRPARLRFSFRAMYDERALYLAARCDVPDLSILRATVTERDGAVFGDDCYELFLDPDPSTPAQYFHLVTNSTDVHYDGIGAKDSSWDGDWTSASVVEDLGDGAGRWSIEFAIPWAALDAEAPATGDTWRFNICRTWFWRFVEEGHGPERYVSFAPTGGAYHTPERFADLRFAGGGPVAGIAEMPFQVSESATITLDARSADRPLPVAVRVEDDEGREIASARATVTDLTGLRLDLSTAAERQDALLTVTVGDPATPILRQQTAIAVAPEFEVALTPHFFAQRLLVEVDITRLQPRPADASALLRLSRGEQSVSEATIPAGDLTDGAASAELSMADAAPGNWSVICRLQRPDGTTAARQVARLTIPETPEWAGNTLGITDEVLEPWTPITTESNRADCWGRTYDFGDLGLPAAIEAGEQQLLAAPIALEATVAGRQAALAISGTWTDHAPNRVAFEATGALGAMAAGLVADMEYDGFVHYALTLTPPHGGALIDAMDLRIPFEPDRAKIVRGIDLLHHAYGKHGFFGYVGGPIFCMGWPDRDWTWDGGFLTGIWVGDDRRGLLWQTDSRRHWHTPAGVPVVEFEQGEASTDLVFHVIGEPTRVTEPMTYHWFVQATPVKPSYERDRRVHVSWNGALDVKTRAGADYYVSWWVLWQDMFGYLEPAPEKERNMAARTRQAEREGIGILPYVSLCSTTVEAPRVRPYAEEWEAIPGGRQAHRGYTMFRICPGTEWADLLVWLVDRTIDRYGISGLYYDVSHALQCRNPAHDHGWIDERGERRPELPVLELRALYKRLYALTRQKIDDPLIFAHQSTMFEGYSHPWTDIGTFGEYWLGLHSYESLTPARARAEYDVHQYGVPFHFFPALNQWRADPHHAMEEILSFALLHDTIPTDVGTESDPLIEVWAIYEQFDTQSAQWVPYYEAEGLITATPEGIEVSLYRRPDDNLLVVANPSYEPASGRVTLNLQALVGAGAASATDMRSGEPVALEDGAFEVQLPARRVTLVRVSR